MDDAIRENTVGQISWEKRIKNTDGTEVCITVEKIKNGYLKTTCIYGGKENDYENNTQKEFLEKNPFETDTMTLLDKLEKLYNK